MNWFDVAINIILSSPIWKTHSSYNLGVAITAIAIVVAFITFISGEGELRFSLNYRKRRIAFYAAFISIILAFLGELDGLFFGHPFIFEIAGAILMFSSILIYLDVILNPLERLDEKQISILENILARTLSNSYLDKPKIIRGCIDLFDNLLNLSLKNKDVQNIFLHGFVSDIFLKHFSESHSVFTRAVQFYVEKRNESKHILDHLEFFLKRLMVKSLENSESFLNMFIEQKIYPDSLFYLDHVMVKEKESSLLQVLFGGYVFFSKLDSVGQLNYVSLVSRYFELIGRKNNYTSLKYGYQKDYKFNDNLIEIFFKEINYFIELCYDQKHLKEIIYKVQNLSFHYSWSLKTDDKSENVKKNTGKFLYNLFYNSINKYNIENEDEFRSVVHSLYNHFLEIQKNGFENNVAYDAFTEKLKGKIIGGLKDDPMTNCEGYFPEIILIYFYIFDFYIPSKKQKEMQVKNLHIPIFSKLAEALPKLYQGFKQGFYDAESLPERKKDLLAKQGRETLDRFFKKTMIYNFEENSLSFYNNRNFSSSKIFLNDVKNNQRIERKEL